MMDKATQLLRVSQSVDQCQTLQEGISSDALDALQVVILLENMRRHLIDVAEAMSKEVPTH